MSTRHLIAGVGLGTVIGVVLGRIFIVRRVRRLLREFYDEMVSGAAVAVLHERRAG